MYSYQYSWNVPPVFTRLGKLPLVFVVLFSSLYSANRLDVAPASEQVMGTPLLYKSVISVCVKTLS
jgi:hypothetical protein